MCNVKHSLAYPRKRTPKSLNKSKKKMFCHISTSSIEFKELNVVFPEEMLM